MTRQFPPVTASFFATAAAFATAVCATAAACAGCGGDGGPKRVFTTDAVFTGNLLGLAGADDQCEREADAAGLGGSWTAWLSDSSANAIDRIQGSGPWQRLDGTVAFADRASLMTGPAVPLDLNAEGAPPAGPCKGVWTGTLPGGNAGSLLCGDWMSATAAEEGTAGSYDRTTMLWTDAIALGVCNRFCSTQLHLYCFEK